MANLLNRIPTNLTEYPNSFKRQGAFPLEAYSVFYKMEDAVAYATSNPIAYVGQTLAVVTANASDPTKVDSVVFYIIADASGKLNVVGKTAIGDEKSVHLDVDGETNIFSLKGFNEAGGATLPQKLPVYKKDAEGNDTEEVDHYELHWVTIDQVVEKDNYSNTKTAVDVAEGEARVLVTQSYDASNDKYTYHLALDLSELESDITERFEAVNTQIEGLGTALTTAKSELNTAIATAKSDVEGSLATTKADLEAADATNLAAAKKYSDDNKAAVESALATEKTNITNAYTKLVNDTKTTLEAQIGANSGDITDLADRATALEGRMDTAEAGIGANTAAINKEASDRAAAVSQEASDRAAAVSTAKSELKTYTDDQIKGLDVTIEKKNNIDHIVIKNASGVEVASVDASTFVKDSFLENVVYDPDTGDITFSFVDNSDDKKDIAVNVKSFVDIYTANDESGIHVVDNEFAIDHNIIATVSHVADVKADVESQITALGTSTATNLQNAVDTINDRIDDTDAEVALKANKTYVDTELAKKVDKTTYETNRTADNKACDDKMAAHVEVMNTELAKKVDKTTYEADKTAHDTAHSELEADIDNQFKAVGEAITAANNRIGDVEKDLDDNYHTKSEVEDIVDGINATTDGLSTAISTLDAKVDANETDAEEKIAGLATRATNLENTVVKKVKVGTKEYTPTSNLVNVAIKDIADQINVGDLADGATYKTSVADAIAAEKADREAADTALTSNLATANAGIQANATAIAQNKANIESNDNDIAALRSDLDNHTTNVHATVNTKIQALENTVNGVEGESNGLVKDVATHGTRIAALEDTDRTHTQQITDLTSVKANKSDVNTTVSQLNADIADRVTKSDFDTFKISNTNTINGVKDSVTTEASNREAGDAQVKKYVDDNFYTMSAANGKFLATTTYESRIQQDVLGIVDNAIGLADKEGGATVGTLVKLVEWVDEHVGDFGTFITETEAGIAENAEQIAANAGSISDNADAIAANKSDIATLTTTVGYNKIKESDEISVGTSGEGGTALGIKQLNVNKLIQTAGEVLILNGGTANA